MLISKRLCKNLTVLAVGSSLLAGCSSGPDLRFSRFWPGGDKPETAANDEAMAEKWRSRLENGDSSSGESSSDSRELFAAAEAEQDAEESRRSRFNIFRRFSRRDDDEKVAEAKSEQMSESEQQRLALERRIAELEAEQREIMARRNNRNRATAPQSAPFQDEKGLNDPFLAASNQKPLQPKVQEIDPSRQQNASLPDWARMDAEETESPQAPVREVAATDAGNQFAPGFEDTLRNLQASAAQDSEPETPTREVERPLVDNQPAKQAPSLPFETKVTASGSQSQNVVRNPFVDVSPEETPSPAEESQESNVATNEPKLDTPITETSDQHPLSVQKSPAQLQRDMARLEVQQLMKRSRIQARAGDYSDALQTAVAAQELASSSDVEFGLREQTPAQLITLIKMKSSETANLAASQSKAASESPVISPQPKPAKRIAARPQADKQSTLPTWPGRTVSNRPKQVEEQKQSAVMTRKSTSPALDDQFKTAEFLHPRPAEASSPGTTSEPQDWHFADRQPQRQGGFMELNRTSRKSSSRNKVRTQLISSSHIYSPENLQWTKLDASLATISESNPAPMPAPPVQETSERPVFADEVEQQETAVADDDPFAAFEDAEVVETVLESDAPPLKEAAPSAPEANSPAVGGEKTMFGIPVHKLGLVGLAGLILLAAIYHRRKTFQIHEH